MSDYETLFYNTTNTYREAMHNIKRHGYKKVYISAYAPRAGDYIKEWFMPPTLVGEGRTSKAYAQASAVGLTPYAWLEYGLKIPAHSPLAKKNRDALIQKSNGELLYYKGQGGTYVYINPRSESGRKYLLNLVRVSLSNKAIGGIHLDDNWSIPAEMGNYHDSLYAVTKEVKDLIDQTAKKQGRDIKLSLSANPISFAANRQNQNWMRWIRDGIVDEMVIQVYRPIGQTRTTINASGYHESKQMVPTSVGIHINDRTTNDKLALLKEMGIEPTVFTWGYLRLYEHLDRAVDGVQFTKSLISQFKD